MTSRSRRNHTPAFKAKVDLTALKDEKPLTRLAPVFDSHPNQITAWKARLLEGAAGVFAGQAARVAPLAELKGLHAEIGELARVNDCLEGALIKAGMAQAQSDDRPHS